jgi:hypothetical protein
VERDDVEGVSKKEGWENAKVVEVKDHGFFFPGFIDTPTASKPPPSLTHPHPLGPHPNQKTRHSHPRLPIP